MEIFNTQKMEQVGGATNPDLRTNSPIRSRTDVGASDEVNILETANNFNHKIIKGRKNSVKTAKGTKIDTVFAFNQELHLQVKVGQLKLKIV